MVPATPLHRPRQAFANPRSWCLNPAVVAGVALGSALLLAIATYALGVELAEQFTGTVTVDNPAYPGDGFCEGPAFDEMYEEVNDESSEFPSMDAACDEPKTVERDPAPIVREAFARVALYVFFGWFILWTGGAFLLHVAAKIAEGDGSLTETFAIAAWSGVPSALASIPAVVLVGYAVQSAELSLENPERTREAIETAVAPAEPVLLLFTVIGTLWQAGIWYAGLVSRHDLDTGQATIVSAVFWVVMLLMSL